MLLPRHLVLLPVLAASCPSLCTAAATSSKRGLLYISSSTSSSDDKVFIQSPTDLTWYYNYGASPTSSIDGLAFVPMLWGTAGQDSFTATVKSQISSGANVSHVLGFNEPDQTSAVGGSNIDPATAATAWKSAIEPLAAAGVKLGGPAVSGSSSGLAWLKSFFAQCGNCTVDFLPLHWYGDFEGLASYIGQVRAAYPDLPLWVTEIGWQDQSLATTQTFFNQSVDYMDRQTYVERYSWFGAFRGSKSNVGPSAAMLNGQGKLTDLGAEYLGRQKTGVLPTSGTRRWGCRLGVLVGGLVAAVLGVL